VGDGGLQQRKLSEEWQQPLGADHKVRFLDRFDEFAIGRFFSPNLRALKSAARAEAGGQGAGSR
jgi:hypothetical protein